VPFWSPTSCTKASPDLRLGFRYSPMPAKVTNMYLAPKLPYSVKLIGGGGINDSSDRLNHIHATIYFI
jgi:hypothetical protein